MVVVVIVIHLAQLQHNVRMQTIWRVTKKKKLGQLQVEMQKQLIIYGENSILTQILQRLVLLDGEFQVIKILKT
jgi:hypothetical protein